MSSKKKVPHQIEYLTSFDLKRGPRILPANYKTQMKFNLKTLNFHQCPICLSYMKKTYIVMECLHRFCGDCIQKCLRMGMKECPSCRVHIPSRRSLRPDTTYDSIMEGMYGNIEMLENREAKEIEEFNRKNNMNNSYSKKGRANQLQQAYHRKKTASSLGRDNEQDNSEASAETNVQQQNDSTFKSNNNTTPPFYNKTQKKSIKIHNMKESQLIEFILRKDPRENSVQRLHRECLKVSKEISIIHLKKFLSKKLMYDPWQDFQITVNVGGRQVVLDDSIQMKQVKNEICDLHVGMMIVLQYFIQPFSFPPKEIEYCQIIQSHDDGHVNVFVAGDSSATAAVINSNLIAGNMV